jgi:hypothetical protein
MMAAILLALCVVSADVKVGGDDALSLQVRRLVRQLDDNRLAERDAAEKALIGLGPAALELLPAPTRNTSAEVQVRLDRVRKALEAAVAEAAAKPSLVTLHGEMPLSEALAAIGKQTGNRIVDFRGKFGQQRSDPKLTVNFDQTPFWIALDRVLDLAGLTAYPFSGEAGAITVVARDEQEASRAARGAYSGLFRFEGVRIQSTRDLRNPAQKTLRLSIEVAWEPRVSPIVLRIPLGQLDARDEQGGRLGIDSRLSNLEVPIESSIPAAEVHVPLELPERGVQKIASLKGSLLALVPGRTETFEFADLAAAKSVEQSRAGVTVVLDQVRKNVDVYEIRVRVRFDRPGIALESHRGWIYNNPAYLVNASGERIEHDGYQAFRQAADEVGVAYLFGLAKGLEGCKFVYQTPALLINMPVEYELKDIPLP